MARKVMYLCFIFLRNNWLKQDYHRDNPDSTPASANVFTSSLNYETRLLAHANLCKKKKVFKN